MLRRNPTLGRIASRSGCIPNHRHAEEWRPRIAYAQSLSGRAHSRPGESPLITVRHSHSSMPSTAAHRHRADTQLEDFSSEPQTPLESRIVNSQVMEALRLADNQKS